ncbi:MAG TPA: NUDIX domain-containing protein [archaeon]|nr:NUDIX domain-containing protein [archaeon]
MEILDVVNEKDEVLRQAERSEVYAKGLLHRVSYIYVKYKGKIIVEKRTMQKKTNPGHYSIVAETVQSKETFEEAAIRGVQEEVGLKAEKLKFLGKLISFDPKYKDNKVCGIFTCEGKGKIKKQDEEVEEIKLMDLEEIEKFQKSEEKIAPAFISTFKVFNEAMK